MVKNLGQRIRELREEKDLSLRELAKKLGGLSAAFLSDVELSRRHPSDKMLKKIAAALGTSFEDLKRYDTRPVVEEFKRLATSDPAYGFAFRKVLEEKVTAEDLVQFVEKREQKKRR